MCRPALNEGLAFGDAGEGSKCQWTRADRAPALRPELAEGIVLCANPLLIQEEVAFMGAVLFATLRKVASIGGGLLGQALA